MKFCPRCGTLMAPRRENEQVVYVCPKCGHREGAAGAGDVASRVLVTTIKHSEKEKLVVIESNMEEKLLPKTRIQCPRCSHDEAYYWVVQTRRADEPPTRFYKCTKCGHVWREYD
ncbi:transcription termination factor Tfs [Pyrolobus fumarii 1A]|uniref:Transcription termination factor Tfs n=1 Tax=Pyrolobus fumarii (strain DSM 11204 / 1A) TaxID=694429 RepID=G0EET8_PYRF1|nr:transcription factor S [Pyrolobus fumarii]AEM38052.1 transcription termination factor Tfs [Pyrolobus fumarii 1A]